LNKNQFHERSGGDGGSFVKQGKTTYELDYSYGTEQPNAPKVIGNKTYTYDSNGNQTGWKSNVSGQEREILWDEENRIRAIADNGAAYHYVYDASGERVIKGKTTGQAVFKNGEKKAGNGSLGNYTVYVNPYIVLQSGGYTKHYFIEGQRIVSKIGGGIDGRGQGPLKAGNDKINYAAKAEKLFEGIVRNEKFIDEDGNLLTAGKSGKVPPGQIIGSNGNNGQSEPFRYFFHPDHLGSTSYITDATGEVYQHSEYFAFGETFVEERGNTDKLPYKFNGKELDEETGLYYYGARYYDAQTSVWMSVDPLSEKYPSTSPYAFVKNNSVNNIEIDGRWFDDKNERVAARIEKRAERAAVKLEKRADKLEGKGKSVGDLRERVSELRQTGQDISDMRGSSTEFRFSKANDNSNTVRDGNDKGLPVTSRTGDDQITMYMDNYKNFHEPRHGGQLARGEYSLDSDGNPSSTYGASHEISTYRAEYALKAQLEYVPAIDLNNPMNLLKLGQGVDTFKQNIQNINQINSSMLKKMVDQPGINQNFIYRNYPDSWWKK